MLLPTHILEILRLIRPRLLRAHHPWASSLLWVLETRLILVVPLPRRISGFTIPFIPVIFLARRLVRAVPERVEMSAYPGIRITDTALSLFLHILLHEAAHQLWAMWPEWQRWFGRRRIYGVDINAADAISEAICRELCVSTRYHGQEIRFRSPLRWIHPVFDR